MPTGQYNETKIVLLHFFFKHSLILTEIHGLLLGFKGYILRQQRVPLLPIIRVPSANQNVTNNIWHEKPEEWQLCLAQKLQNSHIAEDW